MRSSPFWWFLILGMILLDIYVFQALKFISQSAGSKTKLVIYTIYWTLSAAAALTLIFLPLISNSFHNLPRAVRSTAFALIAGLFFAKVIAAIFFLVDDIRRGIQWIAGKLYFSGTEGENYQQGETISRSAFLTWAGMLTGGGLFTSLLYGFNNKYRYQLTRVQIPFQNLPSSFKGLKILQISDIHCGSFNNKTAVLKGVEMAMRENPDLILFTGDLVNNRSDEMDEYMDVFNRFKAPLGVYSILGNHDYGDYSDWPTPEAKRQNLERLKQIHSQLGWRLLMNEHVVLEKGNEKIALLGIENWSSKARFPKYGKLINAHKGTENYPFKILMSHDPSHWDAEVRASYPDIDLMLAGHTHGFQFGVEIAGLKWSPVQYVYKQWAGLYEQGTQKMYINRGFGFIGYPGRVGILPELTLLELS